MGVGTDRWRRKGEHQRQRRGTMKTATAEIRQIFMTISMVEADMRDGGDDSGCESQGRCRLISTENVYTADNYDSGDSGRYT